MCIHHFRVDPSRVASVGADRAAAEWILRLGGKVQFKEFDHWSHDYNRLPSGGKGALKLFAIDGSGLSITSNGLEHLGEADFITKHADRLERLALNVCAHVQFVL